MDHFRKIAGIVLCTVLAMTTSANAARDAVVSAPQADVYANPEAKGQPITKIKSGTSLRVSNTSKNGWFKVRIPAEQNVSEKFGWITEDSISLFGGSKENTAHGIEWRETQRDSEPRRHVLSEFLAIRAGGGLFGIFATDFSDRLNLSKKTPFLAPLGFAQATYLASPTVRIGLRLMAYQASKTSSFSLYSPLVGDSVTRSYTATFTGIPIMAGLDGRLLDSTSFDLWMGLWGGINLFNKVVVTANDFSSPNSFTISGTPFAFYANVNAGYKLSAAFRIVGELGFFYSRIPAKQIGEATNGNDAFVTSSGALQKLSLANLGPVLVFAGEILF